MTFNSTRRRHLVCCGDANDEATWSSTPYFLLAAGKAQGLIDDGLSLKPENQYWQRSLWNLAQLASSGKPGGFQYSLPFTQALLTQAELPRHKQQTLLSLFPMLPTWPWPHNWQVEFYIDATTYQVFNAYGTGSRIAPAFQTAVLEREKQGYQHAKALICMSHWAANSLAENYGIEPDRVHVVPGGANLDERLIMALPTPAPPQAPSRQHPLRLGFIGKDWERKGGVFLLQLAEVLTQKGIPTVIRAIGPNPSQLPRHPALHPLGFISKQTEIDRFVAEVRSWHFGTLFSKAEAFGISNRECLRLGVPVLAHDVGGISSTLSDDGCGQLFSSWSQPKEVADWILGRLTPYDEYLDWRARLSRRWEEFTWTTSVKKLGDAIRSQRERRSAINYYICCTGDATLASTRGGSPFFFVEAMRAKSLSANGLRLDMKQLASGREQWLFKRLLTINHPFGYQYSLAFFERLLKQWPAIDDQDIVISWHPLIVPNDTIRNGKLLLYIDATQSDVFKYYSLHVKSSSLKASAIERERNVYQAAAAIVCMSQWAADSLLRDYEIESAKIHVVPGGANLDELKLSALPTALPPAKPSIANPLKLGFLGKDWNRKGGPFLLQLAEALWERGVPAVVRVIGPNPRQLPRHSALQPLGFISKQADLGPFVAEVQNWHFGTLFSVAEAFGISNRECLRLGVPVLAHRVGGIPSSLPDDGCGHIFQAHPSAAEVADWIVKRLSPYEEYLAWRERLALRWREFTWEATIEKFLMILETSQS